MTNEKQIPDRMKKYNVNLFSIVSGIGGALFGVATVNQNLSIAGQEIYCSSLALLGYSIGQSIDYMKGYFNERLEIENQRNEILKQNKLENISKE
mgnify:CR=1 FL=1